MKNKKWSIRACGMPPTIKITRKNIKIVRQWLSSFHNYFSRTYMDRSSFPTDISTIKRYFMWCNRHRINPSDSTSRCMYWGISEQHKIGSIECPPTFHLFNVAYFEKLFGRSYDFEEPNDNGLSDRWYIVVEWFTEDEEYLMENRDWIEQNGRILKKEMSVDCKTSTMSFSFVDSVAVYTQPKFSFRYSASYANKCSSETYLTPIDHTNTTLDEVLYEAGCMLPNNGAKMPHKWKTIIKTQKYVYRKNREDAESLRLKNRFKRHQRRRKK